MSTIKQAGEAINEYLASRRRDDHSVIEMEITGGTRFILPQATPSAIEDMEWMVPHFATAKGKLIMSVHALVVDTPVNASSLTPVLATTNLDRFPPGAISSFPSWRTWRRRATRENHRYRTLHASSRRSCRLEHDASGWPMDTYLSQCSLSHRQRGI